MKKHMIFTNFLKQLHVRHTADYSDSQFRGLTFKSLFGLSTLLDRYGVRNSAWKVPVKGSLSEIKTPFLAQRNGQFDIITSICNGMVHYISGGEIKSRQLEDYEKNWGGVVMVAEATADSSEPDYQRHMVLDCAKRALTWIMVAAMLCVLAYLYVTRDFYMHAAETVLIAVDIAGVAVTSMLMLKSLKVHSDTADRVCGVLQEGGCDKILSMDAAKFFGLFGWAEVGFGYFTVSTATLLVFPSYVHYLALANLCCLPFTLWSIWYQKFRAHHWCTLCIITQLLLWCQFVCYLCGWYERDFDLYSFRPWILLCSYVSAVLVSNKFAEIMNRSKE